VASAVFSTVVLMLFAFNISNTVEAYLFCIHTIVLIALSRVLNALSLNFARGYLNYLICLSLVLTFIASKLRSSRASLQATVFMSNVM
jgi:hypothetical protein